MVPPTSHKVSRVSWYFGSCRLCPVFRYGAFTLSGRLSQNRSLNLPQWLVQSVTPACTHAGLGSFHFARRYSGNRVFFLFLRLLRCFSSPGSLPYVMDWRMDDWGLLSRVSPFRYLRINGYLLLPEAFRSLSRLSSALSAKASTLRSSSLNLCNQPAKQDGCFPVRIALQTGGFGLFLWVFSHVNNVYSLLLVFYKSIIFILNLSSDVLWWIN